MSVLAGPFKAASSSESTIAPRAVPDHILEQ